MLAPTFYVLLANGMNAFASIAIVFIVSQLGTFEDAARLGFAIALIAPVQLLLSMQHGSLLVVGGIKSDELRLLRFFLAILLILIGAMASIVLVDGLLLVLSTLRATDLLFEVRFVANIYNKKYINLLSDSILRALSQLFFISLTYYLTRGIEIAILSGVITALPWLDLSKINVCRNSIKKAIILAQKGWLLGLSALIASVSPYIPRYFQNANNGLVKDLAAFSGMMSIIFGATLLITSTSSVFFTGINSSQLKLYLRNTLPIAGFMFIAGYLISVMFGYFVVRLTLGAKYLPYASYSAYFSGYFTLLAILHICNMVFIKTNKFKLTIAAACINATITLLICFLVEVVNFKAAFMAVSIGSAFAAIFSYIVSYRLLLRTT